MIINRVKELIAYKEVTIAVFAKSINVNEDEVVAVCEGTSQVNTEFIKQILKNYPEINANWLMLGEGEMIYKKEGDRYVKNLDGLAPEEILDYMLLHPDKFRSEPKIDAIVTLFSNFEQQRELQKMYDKIVRYEKLLEEKIKK